MITLTFQNADEAMALLTFAEPGIRQHPDLNVVCAAAQLVTRCKQQVAQQVERSKQPQLEMDVAVVSTNGNEIT